MIFDNYDRIIFSGDSITEMGSPNPIGEGLGGDGLGMSYVRIIANMLEAWYPERAIRVINAGISGNTSRDLLARFDRDVVGLHPQWVSICIGINDVWRQFDNPAVKESWVLPKEYRDNVDGMVSKIIDKVKGVFIITPYYIEPNKADRMRNRMDEYGEICKEISQKYGCKLVDFQKMYDQYCQYKHSSRIAWDRVHPNLMGATLMAKEFLKYCDFDYNRQV